MQMAPGPLMAQIIKACLPTEDFQDFLTYMSFVSSSL